MYKAASFIKVSRIYVVTICLLAACWPNLALGQTCSEITTQNRLSVVHIQVEKTDKITGAIRVNSGTGFIVSESGLVITNKHVVAPGANTELPVRISGAVGSRAGQRTGMHWLADSTITDIAIIQFDDTSRIWKASVIGNPWRIEIGHSICSMSFPLDIEFLIARGVVTGKGAPNGWWYSDMPSNPGDSGAAVFDAADGKVIGLKVGDRDDTQGLSYLIPVNLASDLLRSFSGVEVPKESDRVSAATPIQFTNSNIKCQISGEPFARDHCAVSQCPSGQWVRGSAELLSSGDVIVRQGLETDRLDLGVCGWVQFTLLDQQKSVLGYGYNQRRCIGAKSPLGSARIEEMPPEQVRVPAPIANRVAAIDVRAFCGGDNLAPLGIGGNAGPEKSSLSLILGAATNQ